MIDEHINTQLAQLACSKRPTRAMTACKAAVRCMAQFQSQHAEQQAATRTEQQLFPVCTQPDQTAIEPNHSNTKCSGSQRRVGA